VAATLPVPDRPEAAGPAELRAGVPLASLTVRVPQADAVSVTKTTRSAETLW
jgi:hypothetical protein